MMSSTIKICQLILMSSIFLSCEDKNNNQNNGHTENDISLSELFDVKGATAVATTTKGIGDSALLQTNSKQENDLLKISEEGEYQSIFKKIDPSWNLKIAVMEIGPDGSLYVGLDWGIWIRNDSPLKRQDGKIPNFGAPMTGQNIALFRIKPSGETEIVDPDINGMGHFYNKEFLSKKQIQFDSEGSVYYLGRQGQTTVLKKKSMKGEITQIGNSRMEVRDFMVSPNGMVFFNGANKGDWDTQWLRIFHPDKSVVNIFYREGDGWLKSYFIDKNNNLILVGSWLVLGNERKIYNGIVRVNLVDGKIISFEELLNDTSMQALSNNVIYFSSSKQLVMRDDGSVYAIVPQYIWSNPQDKVFRILNASGEVSIKEFPTHVDYKNIKLAKIIDKYLVYLSSLNGTSAMIKINLDDDKSMAQEITGIKSNIEIYSFSYHPRKKQLIYDVYDLQNNSSFVVEQDLETALVFDEKNLDNFNIIDLVPFVAL